MIGGLFFIALSYGLVYFINRKNALVFFLSISAHLTLSLSNFALNGQLPGADADAQTFYLKMDSVASDLSFLNFEYPDILNGSLFFINIYGLIQFIFGGPSFFLAHMISLLGSSLCLLFVHKICVLVGVASKKINSVIFFYTFTPGVLLYQSYILREVWQSLFVLTLVWCGIYWKSYGFKNPSIILVFLFSYAIGILFHHSLVYTLLLVAFEVVLLGFGRLKIPSFKSLSDLISLLFLFGGFFIFLYISNSANEGSIIENAGSFVEGAKGSIEDARTNYGATFSSSQPWTVLISLLYYQLTPFPFQISSIIDLVSVFENGLRLYLVWLWWKNRKRLSLPKRNIVDGLVIIWFSVEIIWSIGTFNWGTAARHHIPALSLLTIAAFSCKFLPKSFASRKL